MNYRPSPVQVCTVRRTINGGWAVTGWAGALYISRTFYYYTRAEAVREWTAVAREVCK